MSEQPGPQESSPPLTSIIGRKIVTELKNAQGLAVLGCYLAIAFLLTHVSLSGTVLDYRNLPSQFQLIDKIYHFGSYSILAFLVLFAFTPKDQEFRGEVNRASARRMITLCVLVICYGIFDEVSQPFFGRSFEAMDLIANFFGIAFGQGMFVVLEATGIRRKLLNMM